MIGCPAAREATTIAREKERESEWGVIGYNASERWNNDSDRGNNDSEIG